VSLAVDLDRYQRSRDDVRAALGKDHPGPRLPVSDLSRDGHRARCDRDDLCSEPLVRSQPGIEERPVGPTPGYVTLDRRQWISALPARANGRDQLRETVMVHGSRIRSIISRLIPPPWRLGTTMIWRAHRTVGVGADSAKPAASTASSPSEGSVPTSPSQAVGREFPSAASSSASSSHAKNWNAERSVRTPPEEAVGDGIVVHELRPHAPELAAAFPQIRALRHRRESKSHETR